MLLSAIFKQFKKPVYPKPGEQWVLNSDGSPWPEKELVVNILEAKGGWVRYSMGPIFNCKKMKSDIFIAIYKNNS